MKYLILNFFTVQTCSINLKIISQYLVFLTWIAFRVQDFDDLVYSMEKYVFLDFATEKTTIIILEHRFEILIMVLFFLLHFISYKKPNLPERISHYRLPLWGIFLTVIILGILFFFDGNSEDFIYFQF